jgi:hypothetical protein
VGNVRLHARSYRPGIGAAAGRRSRSQQLHAPLLLLPGRLSGRYNSHGASIVLVLAPFCLTDNHSNYSTWQGRGSCSVQVVLHQNQISTTPMDGTKISTTAMDGHFNDWIKLAEAPAGFSAI